MGIWTPGKNKGAYQGELTCPFVIGGKSCKSRAIRFVEDVTPLRQRYRCRKCGNTFQYDISNRRDINPYAAYRKGTIWSSIDKVLRATGVKLKGGGLQ